MSNKKILLGYVIPILALAIGVALSLWVFRAQDPWPDFSAHPIKTVDGRTLAPESLRNKVVLVNFWATSCTSCVAEMPQLKRLYQDLRDKNFELIAVAMPYDQANLVSQFRANQALPFPVAHDEKNQWVPRFGKVVVTPTFMLYDTKGRKQYAWIGPMADDKLRATITAMLQ